MLHAWLCLLFLTTNSLHMSKTTWTSILVVYRKCQCRLVWVLWVKPVDYTCRESQEAQVQDFTISTWPSLSQRAGACHSRLRAIEPRLIIAGDAGLTTRWALEDDGQVAGLLARLPRESWSSLRRTDFVGPTRLPAFSDSAFRCFTRRDDRRLIATPKRRLVRPKCD